MKILSNSRILIAEFLHALTGSEITKQKIQNSTHGLPWKGLLSNCVLLVLF
jgi:hypothetical protein